MNQCWGTTATMTDHKRESNHLKWVKRLTGNASGRTIANQSGIPVATLNRQINKGIFTAEVVIAIARGYGESPVEALVATGYITSKEVTGVDEVSAPQLLTSQQLVQELARRINLEDKIQ
nr:MAG TPA: repressor protein CI [Caudoviricetes sp.]